MSIQQAATLFSRSLFSAGPSILKRIERAVRARGYSRGHPPGATHLTVGPVRPELMPLNPLLGSVHGLNKEKTGNQRQANVDIAEENLRLQAAIERSA